MSPTDRNAGPEGAAGSGPARANRAPAQIAEPTVSVARSIAWSVLGTALGLALLYAATRQVDPQALNVTLRTLSWTWAILVLGATLVFCALKAWRWHLLLGGFAGVRFRELHAAVYVGLAVNFLVSHVGEVFRATTVARRNRLPFSAVFASIVIERVLDFVAILGLLAGVVTAVGSAPRVVTTAAAVSAAVVVTAVAFLILSLHPPAWTTGAAARLGRHVRPDVRDRLGFHLARFRAGLAPLTNPRLMALALLASAAQWGLVVASIWACGLAVTGSVSPMAAIVTFVLIVIGLTLPNSPLQIGTTQLAFVVGLGIDGTTVNEAIAASLVYSSCLILPIMLAGGLLMLRGRLGAGGR